VDGRWAELSDRLESPPGVAIGDEDGAGDGSCPLTTDTVEGNGVTFAKELAVADPELSAFAMSFAVKFESSEPMISDDVGAAITK
jgi:hypothetical protein